jgi:hypothetical protein
MRLQQQGVPVSGFLLGIHIKDLEKLMIHKSQHNNPYSLVRQ